LIVFSVVFKATQQLTAGLLLVIFYVFIFLNG